MSSSASLTEPGTTRDALLAAGRDLLLSKQPFSMGSVARAAGVSRQAVYLHFADRYALLEAIVDGAIAETSVNASRDKIEAAPTGRAALGLLLETVVGIAMHHGAVDQAVRHTLASDPKLADRWAKRKGRSATIRLVASRLEAEDALRPGVSSKACEAVLNGFVSPEVVLPLVKNVTESEATDLLVRAVSAALLRSNLRVVRSHPKT
jgi:AcrR family transcriptional regulator